MNSHLNYKEVGREGKKVLREKEEREGRRERERKRGRAILAKKSLVIFRTKMINITVV